MKEIKICRISKNSQESNLIVNDNPIEGSYYNDDFVLTSDYYYSALVVSLMVDKNVNKNLIERIERLQSFIRLYMKYDYYSENENISDEIAEFNSINNKENIIMNESESIKNIILKNVQDNNNNCIEKMFPKIIRLLEKNKFKKNCFCYCKYKNKQYIAISGASKDYKSKEVNYFKWEVSKEVKDILDIINNDYFNGNATICHCNPLVPFKYNFPSDNNCYLYNFGFSPIFEEYCKRNFSCCERKIISHIKSFDESKAAFYCKYLCCEMCFPFVYKSKFYCLYDNKFKLLKEYYNNYFLLVVDDVNNLIELEVYLNTEK